MIHPPGPTHPSLATSRPWLSVAGCLGGGALLAFATALLVIAAAVILLLVPDLIFPSKGGTTAFISALGELRKAPALRVATREVAVRVDVSVPTEVTLRAWIVPIGPGWTVELGRTKVEIIAPGNVAQYIVALDAREDASDALVEATDEAVIITLPAPRVDESLVEVQSDPKKLRIEVDRDWVDHVVGDDAARDEALALIRAAVVRVASSNLALFEVREKSRAIIAEMIRALVPEQDRAREIRIRWADEASSASSAN